MSSFRITLFLNHFFSDQRSSCRVYVTSQIKTIQDLHDHINKIFDLNKNFYLVSNNLYLPSAEDVRILKEDEVVVLIPSDTTQPQSRSETKVNKTKRKRSSSVVNERDELLEVNGHPRKNKTKRKHVSENGDSVDARNDAELVSNSNKKKKKKDKANTSEVDECMEIIKHVGISATKKEDNDEKLCNDSSDNVDKDSLSTYPSSVRLLSLKPKTVELMKVSNKPNIVKIIRVYDRRPSFENHFTDNCVTASTPMKPEVDSQFSKEEEDHVEILPEISKVSDVKNDSIEKTVNEDKDEDKVENILIPNDVLLHPQVENSIISTEDYSESVASSVTEDGDNLGFVKPKRKRKRTRKKKTRAEVVVPDVTAIEPQIVEFSNNHQHIRFSDEEHQIGDTVTSQNDTVDDKENNSLNEMECSVENVGLVSTAISLSSYETLCDEEVTKFPIMSEILPKAHDVIAFKLYVLSKEYTPEVSNFIIAQVLCYNEESQEVLIKIIAGGEQCDEPEGRFSMEIDRFDGNKETKCFLWQTLREPRLLFP